LAAIQEFKLWRAEEGKRVLYRNTLQLANLDANEVEGTIEVLSLMLAKVASELIAFHKQ
jgi:hypothetical protein